MESGMVKPINIDEEMKRSYLDYDGYDHPR
jgi:DNA gyrase/topoisomerase IV subunit A